MTDRKTAADLGLAYQIDCEQDGVCAVSPGCNRHWQERNRELVAERDAAIARAESAEKQLAECDSKLIAAERARDDWKARHDQVFAEAAEKRVAALEAQSAPLTGSTTRRRCMPMQEER